MKKIDHKLYQSGPSGVFEVSERFSINVPESLVLEEGDILFLKNGFLHNTKGPALISKSMTMVLFCEHSYIHNLEKPVLFRYEHCGNFDYERNVYINDSEIIDKMYAVDGHILNKERFLRHPKVKEVRSKAIQSKLKSIE